MPSFPTFNHVFRMFSIPEVVNSDNGLPFHSSQFNQIAETLGFKDHRGTPLWPQANIEAERLMRNLGKVVRTALTEDQPWKLQLMAYLRNHCATIHAAKSVWT